jgi:TRAP-type C4-dicarboxylate transport system permease small subunit
MKILIGLISSVISMIFVMLFFYISLEYFELLFVDFMPEIGQDDLGIGILMMGWLTIVVPIGVIIWIVASIIIFKIFAKRYWRNDNG